MKLPNFWRRLSTCVATLSGVAALFISFASVQAEDLTGEQIYQQKCASCHGVKGEGNKDHQDKPLIGDKPLVDLTKVIAETMPEDDPGSLKADEAAKVAAYIYDAFYSEIAQARNKPARVELSRLTVRQYHNAVVDLVGSFTGTGEWKEPRGLAGEYYNSRRFRRSERAIERHDPVVDFNFGKESPDPKNDKLKAEEFAIRWEGSLLAPDTGEYEILVKTENAARLWLNDEETPLIDAWVKSGSDTDHRETIQLLGGRVYRLRMEFFKSKKEEASSISLEWKAPHQVMQPIPARNLSPHWAPKVLVLTTPFPPDDRSVGYERGTSVSKEWDQAATYAALETAAYVSQQINRLADVKDGDSNRRDKLKEFCRRFAERAFRRPLTDEQKQLFVDRHFEGDSDLDLAVKKSILLTLKSPRFLYREIGGPSQDSYDAASRLAFALWDSIPDQQLLDAAARNELQTREQISRQAERMLADLRAKSKLREFFHQWLKVDHMTDLSKDQQAYPEFNETIASDLRLSLDLFLEDVIWSDASDFRQLLLAESLFLNGRLAPLYGVSLAADAPFEKVSFEPQQRAGVLSHPFLMTGFAYHATTSPIHRGVFIARSLLGRSLRPPPVAVSPLSPDLHAALTTRERVDLQTSPNTCQACHSMINPLGYSLEHYDALGRYRTEEKGRPIDATGSYRKQDGDLAQFHGVRELAVFLAGSEEAHGSFVEQLFHHLVKQPMRAYGNDQPDRLRRLFVEQGFNMKRLAVEIATTAAMPASK